MSDAHIDDADRLQHVLQQLGGGSDPTTADGRLICEKATADALTSILRAIDETVLPRRLTFSGARNHRLCCEVAERRIMRFEEDQALSKGDAAQVASQIEAFCAAGADIHLRSEILAQSKTTGEVGVSVADLLMHLSTNVVPRDGVALIDRALSESASYALAIVDQQVDGSTNQKGQSQLCEKLRQLSDTSEPPNTSQPSETVARDIWIGADVTGFAILRVVSSTRQIWMALEVEHLDDCVAVWSRLG